MKFKIGDKVKIKKDSDFSFQIPNTDNQAGIIIRMEDDTWYTIEFPNNYINSYGDIDLELVKSEEQEALDNLTAWLRDTLLDNDISIQTDNGEERKKLINILKVFNIKLNSMDEKSEALINNNYDILYYEKTISYSEKTFFNKTKSNFEPVTYKQIENQFKQLKIINK